MLKHRIAVKVAFFLNGFIYANWVSRLPRIQEQFNADNGTIGVVLLSLSLGAVFAMPFTGWLIVKNGSRRLTLFSVLAYCLFVPLIPFMPNLIALIVLYIIMGMITGMLDVAMNAQAVMVEQQYNKPIMTSFHAFFSIGMALGAWCGALFSDLHFGLVNHFFIIAGISILSALWVSFNLIVDKPERSKNKDEGPLLRFPNKALIGVGIIAFCCMMGEGAMADWTVNFMENIASASTAVAPIALSGFATAMTLGRLFGDALRARYGDSRLIVFGGLLSIAGLLLALALPLPYAAIGGFFLVGLGLSTIVPITYSIAGNEKDLPKGVGLAMVTTVGYSGFLFGPPIIGFIADNSNLRFGLSLVLLLFVVMTVLGMLQKPKRPVI
ncbi:MFS transporter [Chryseosolibacter indicus]|uniref:MFS transporter n=1 Tax=Chryseosolibacter indicus TaxID=2782351 RepID=A0ABS5VQR6_9BACT|nr:MFS transporter [Chryseosolibacter indicus]